MQGGKRKGMRTGDAPAPFCCGVEGRALPDCSARHRGSACEQQRDDVRMAPSRGHVQRRLTREVRLVDGNALLDPLARFWQAAGAHRNPELLVGLREGKEGEARTERSRGRGREAG
eukprot:941679-Rhodomonas_salina.1